MRLSFYSLLSWIAISMALSLPAVQPALAQATQQGHRIEGVSQAEIVQWQFRYGGPPVGCFPVDPPPACFGPQEIPPVCQPTGAKKRYRRK